MVGGRGNKPKPALLQLKMANQVHQCVSAQVRKSLRKSWAVLGCYGDPGSHLLLFPPTYQHCFVQPGIWCFNLFCFFLFPFF